MPRGAIRPCEILISMNPIHPSFHSSSAFRHLASLLCLTLALQAFAGPDAVLIFGDSAADQGNLHATPGYGPGAHAPYYRGTDGLVRLSDGPMWTERLFPSLRSINADGPMGRSVNFAYGAATTGASTFGAGEAGELPVGVQSQVTAYQALLASDALPTPGARTWAFIEAGPNDFFAALAQGEDLVATAVSSPARLADSARRLAETGLRTIFVTETPDFGEAPLFGDLGLPPAAHTALREVAALSRTNLRAELSRLQTELGDSHRIVVLPVNELFRAVLAHPAAFGFTNVTGKTYDEATDTLLVSDPARRAGYLFVDSLHTTSLAQAWQARFYAEVIGAIDGTAQGRYARAVDAQHTGADLVRRLGNEALAGPASADRWTWFVSARGSRVSGDASAPDGGAVGSPAWRSDAIGSLVGARRLVTPYWTLGIGLGNFVEEGRVDGRRLRWDNNAGGVWLLNAWNLDPVTVRLSVGAANLDTEFTRDTSIPTFIARGDTVGYLWQTRFEVERTLGRIANHLQAEVMLGTTMTRSSVKAFQESGAPGLNLAVGRLAHDRVISDAGLRLRGSTLRLGRIAIEPSADLLVTHASGDRNTDVTARLLDNSAAAVTASVNPGPRTRGVVRVAFGVVLTERLRAEIADQFEAGSGSYSAHRVELGLTARF